MRLKLADLKTAISDYNGNLTSVAAHFGCSRPTIYKRIKEDPEIAASVDDARESMIDVVENVLYDKAKAGEAWAVCFFLKTQGKRRGYIERQEITGAEGGRIIIELDNGHTSESPAKSV